MHINDINRVLLKAQFPEYTKNIQEIFDESEDFTDLVNDYLFCKKEVNRLSRSKKYILASEYKETLKALEKELLRHLNAQKEIHNSYRKSTLHKNKHL